MARLALVAPFALGACASIRGPRITAARRRFSLHDALEALVDPAATVVVPAGDHALPNPVIVHGARGTLAFAPGAVLRCERTGRGGLHFFGAEDLRVTGLAMDWPAAPEVRSHEGAGLFFSDTRRLVLDDIRVSRAPGGGIQFDRCEDVEGRHLTVRGTSADGVHAANSRGFRLHGIDTADTGDDGLAFVAYGAGRIGRDVQVESVRVVRSRARGIAVLGYEDVRIDDVDIAETRVSGVLVGTDAFYKTHRANRVQVSRARIAGAGSMDAATRNKFGVEIHDCGDVSLDRVTIDAPVARGLSALIAGTVTLDRVDIRMGRPEGAVVDVQRCTALTARELTVRADAGLPMSVTGTPDISLTAMQLASNAPGPDGVVLRTDLPGGLAYQMLPERLVLRR